MLGQAPQRRTVSRRPDGTMPAVDFKMSPVAAQLDAVRSVGERPKAARSDASGDFSVGGTTSFQSASSGLSGDVTGDLSALMATLPGISVTPNVDGSLSISAFGIGGDQNGLVLNGMNFGAQVPRDGFRVAVISASYDPGRGGFAGVQQSLRMQPGNNTITRSTHVTFDAPGLQWTSPVASNLGTTYGQQIASGTVGGPIVPDKFFYSSAYQFSRRASGLTSLESADRRVAPRTAHEPRLGPAVDGSHRHRRAFRTARLACRMVERTRRAGSRSGSTSSRTFRLRSPAQFFQNDATFDDYYLELGGSARNNGGAMIGPTSIPSSGGEISHRDGWAQFTSAKYLPRNTLNETTISVSGAEDRTNPYLDLPSANILARVGAVRRGRRHLERARRRKRQPAQRQQDMVDRAPQRDDVQHVGPAPLGGAHARRHAGRVLGPTGRRLRHVRVQFARGFRERHSDELLANAHVAPHQRYGHDRRDRARRRVQHERRTRRLYTRGASARAADVPVRRARRGQPFRLPTGVQRQGRFDLRRAHRPRPGWRTRDADGRVYLAALPRLQGQRPFVRPSRRHQRRCARVSRYAFYAVDRLVYAADRTAERHSAVVLHRRGGPAAGLGGLPARRVDPDRLRERRRVHAARPDDAAGRALRAQLHALRQLAPRVQRELHAQHPVPRLGERHVGHQPQRSRQLRSQLQPRDALQPRQRGRSAYLRLADEHRAGDGRRDVRRFACVVGLRARERGAFGSAQPGADGRRHAELLTVPNLLRRSEHRVLVRVRVVQLQRRARAVSRISEHGRRSA